MNIDFQTKIKEALENIDQSKLTFVDCVIGGDECVLVVGKDIKIKWNQKNKYLRSVIYRKADYFPISLSFPKFLNWGENPANFPTPVNLNHATIVEKIDGTLICISKYKNQIIVRTRGTYDAYINEDPTTLDLIKTTYPKLFAIPGDTWNFSIVLEWISSISRPEIVIKDPTYKFIHLIGIMDHRYYSLKTQNDIDAFAQRYNLPRPNKYIFKSNEEMLGQVTKLWKNKEGVVVYTNGDQDLFKLKTEDYLIRHSARAKLNTYNGIYELFWNYNCPSIEEFKFLIAKDFDPDDVVLAEPFIKLTNTRYQEAKEKLNKCKGFVATLVGDRKTMSAKIQSNFSGAEVGICFMLLDGKSDEKILIKKLM